MHENQSNPTNSLPELTCKVFVISILLTIILAISNAYLALKIGILTSASIPAAILSMAILRFFNQANILESNLVQTCASTGEAVAGGVVYTMPALIIIGYWKHFDYWPTVLISLLGGILGVLFSVPVRKVLLNQQILRFPEGRAIAEVLHVNARKAISVKNLFIGGIIGSILELLQNGLKIVAEHIQIWFSHKGVIFGFSSGLSATLIGTGYLVGFDIGVSLLIGAIIGWFFCIPIITYLNPVSTTPDHVVQAVMQLWSDKIRYIGLGAMLVTGLWTLLTLFKDIVNSIKLSWYALRTKQLSSTNMIPANERDIPLHYVASGIFFIVIATGILFYHLFNMYELGFPPHYLLYVVSVSLLYILFIGFIIAALCGYFSGMVGVTATPGSSLIIAGMLMAALLLRTALSWFHSMAPTEQSMLTAAAITIMIGSLITSAAAIANDNIQDLKVGQLVGSTPWKQQLMLIMGVIIGSFIIPPIMELLYNIYGIANVFPHPNMNPSRTLPAPPAALMAAVTQSVFQHKMPVNMLITGAVLAVVSIIIVKILNSLKHWKLSVIGIATGIYLPLSSSTSIFIGSLLCLLVNKRLNQNITNQELLKKSQQYGLLLACGLVAGSAIMNVLLAIPFAIIGSSDALNILPSKWSSFANGFGIIITITLCIYFYKRVVLSESHQSQEGKQ